MFTSCKSETTGLSFNFNKGYLTQWIFNNGDNQIENTISSLIGIKYALGYGCNITSLTLDIIGDSSKLTYSINGIDYQRSTIFNSVPNGTVSLRIKDGTNVLTIPVLVSNVGNCIDIEIQEINMLSLICLSDNPIFQTINIVGC